MTVALTLFLLSLSACGRFAQEKNAAASQAAVEAVAESEAAPEEQTKEPETMEPEKEEIQVAGTDKTTVTVVSDHGVRVVPDTAEIMFGVQTMAASAKKAQEDNAGDVNNVIAKLKEMGVEEKDIRTTGYDMYPRYDNNGQRIIGYTMYTNLAVSNQSIDKAGEIVSGCVEAGVNQMNGITYTYSGYNEAYAEALGNATKAASVKAEAIASAAGRKIGAIESISEGYQNTSLRNSYQDLNMLAAKEEAAMDSVAILPGEVDVRATVTVTYVLE